MLSRVADAIYWMNRYVERAENIARFVDVSLQLSIDIPGDEQWAPLVATAGDEALFRERYGEATKENVLHFLTFDRDYASSIVSSLAIARENARSVREIISSEMWEALNRAYLFVTSAEAPRICAEAPHEFFTQVKLASHLLEGVTHITMSHNEAWHFGRLGRKLERADMTSRLVDVKYFLILPSLEYVGSALDEVQWGALLRSASAFEMYRKQYGQIVPAKVVSFLFHEATFPRSIRYCLRKASHSLHAITGTPLGSARTSAEKELGRLVAEVDYAHLEAIMNRGLHEHLDEFQSNLLRVGAAIFDTFFASNPNEELTPPPPSVLAL